MRDESMDGRAGPAPGEAVSQPPSESGLEPGHARWLAEHGAALLDFGRGFPHPSGGAAYLDEAGAPRLDLPVHTWITARMCHVYSLAALQDVPDARRLAQHAFDGLRGILHDPLFGGWYSAVQPASPDPDGRPAGIRPFADGHKVAYDHVFVLLAATSALVANLRGARGLLDDASAVLLDRFWDEDAGMCVDTWSRDWEHLDPYRGLNANMHAVEAMLAAGDATSETPWFVRARRVAERVVELARVTDWRLPEHFDAQWRPILDYNVDQPGDQFKPYGATVGHGLEWSRLLAQLATVSDERTSPGLVDAATHLYQRAVADGWAADGRPGFVYTTDWEGRPIVRERMHWVVAEAIGAAWTLHDATGEPGYLQDYTRWWDFARTYLLDGDRGSWHHELDPDNHPSAAVWPGKPDIYHAYQATLIPRLPRGAGLARSIAAGRLR